MRREKARVAFGLGFWKWAAKGQDPRVRAVYDRLVAQARLPVFYRSYGVADTVSGRFDMIVLHAFLFFQRLKNADGGAKDFGQAVFDAFIEDMDRSLREMGVGYQAVPKRMKKMGEAFYGRVAAYDAALAAGDKTALERALRRNIFPHLEEEAGSPRIAALADYVLAGAGALHSRDPARLYAAEFSFPDPVRFLKDEHDAEDGRDAKDGWDD